MCEHFGRFDLFETESLNMTNTFQLMLSQYQIDLG